MLSQFSWPAWRSQLRATTRRLGGMGPRVEPLCKLKPKGP
jgi:hypothetical protein